MFSFSVGDLLLHTITNALHALIYVAEGIKWIRSSVWGLRKSLEFDFSTSKQFEIHYTFDQYPALSNIVVISKIYVLVKYEDSIGPWIIKKSSFSKTDFRANFLLCEAKGRPNEYYIAELSLEVMVANMVLEIGQYSKLFYKEVPQGPLWGFSYAYSMYLLLFGALNSTQHGGIHKLSLFGMLATLGL